MSFRFIDLGLIQAANTTANCFSVTPEDVVFANLSEIQAFRHSPDPNASTRGVELASFVIRPTLVDRVLLGGVKLHVERNRHNVESFHTNLDHGTLRPIGIYKFFEPDYNKCLWEIHLELPERDVSSLSIFDASSVQFLSYKLPLSIPHTFVLGARLALFWEAAEGYNFLVRWFTWWGLVRMGHAIASLEARKAYKALRTSIQKI